METRTRLKSGLREEIDKPRRAHRRGVKNIQVWRGRFMVTDEEELPVLAK